MKKDCLVCPYCELPLGDSRVHCHCPLITYTKIISPGDSCPMDNGLDESKIKQAFLEDHCKVATCTGLSYSTFKRIAEYFYKLGKEDGNRTDI